jgi:hypothetical protein
MSAARQVRDICVEGQQQGDHVHDLMNVYELMEGKEVNARGVWQMEGGQERFMYYGSNKEWFISNRADMEAGKGWMNVASAALTPEQITETWQLWDGTAWIAAPKVRACKKTIKTVTTQILLDRKSKEDAAKEAAEASIIANNPRKVPRWSEASLRSCYDLILAVPQIVKANGCALRLVCEFLKERAGADDVVPAMPSEPSFSLGDGTAGFHNHQLFNPGGIAFVPFHPELIVVTLIGAHQVRVYHIRTGAMLCKAGRSDGQSGGSVSVSAVHVLQTTGSHCPNSPHLPHSPHSLHLPHSPFSHHTRIAFTTLTILTPYRYTHCIHHTHLPSY